MTEPRKTAPGWDAIAETEYRRKQDEAATVKAAEAEAAALAAEPDPNDMTAYEISVMLHGAPSKPRVFPADPKLPGYKRGIGVINDRLSN